MPDPLLSTYHAVALRIRRGKALPDDYSLFRDLLARLDRQGDYDALLSRMTNLENKFNLLQPSQVASLRRGL